MINLRTRGEYSFRFAYGKIEDIIRRDKELYVALTDRFTTFGHIPFFNLCKKYSKIPIFGVELAFVEDSSLKVRQTPYFATLLATNQNGLTKIYELVSKASAQKYYFNRLSYDELLKLPEDDIVVIFENSKISNFLMNRRNTYYGISPLSNFADYNNIRTTFPILAISDNLYDIADHENLYQIILGNGQYDDRNEPSHLLSENEWRNSIAFLTDQEKTNALSNIDTIVNLIQVVEFKQANLPQQTKEKSLRELCIEGAKIRKCNLEDPIYKERMDRELDLIAHKQYEDYFYLVRDLIVYAKQHMLVGPARGSSAGSLVAFLLNITDIDPLKFDLIFERFIDINRGGYNFNKDFVDFLSQHQ